MSDLHSIQEQQKPEAELTPALVQLAGSQESKGKKLSGGALVVILIGVLLTGFVGYQAITSWLHSKALQDEARRAGERLKEVQKDQDKLMAAYEEFPFNEMLKRIKNEGGATPDAIRANMRSVDESVTYEHLKKNSDKYIGTAWACQGRILQTKEAKNLYDRDQTEAQIALNGDDRRVIWVIGNFTSDFVENDKVYVVGYLGGDYSYRSQMGSIVEMPALSARTMLKPSEAASIIAELKRN